jgi:putative two-component system response regulator
MPEMDNMVCVTDTGDRVERATTDEGTNRKKVLFVDDEPNFLAGLRRMLRGQRDQWDFFFAGGVDEALELVKRERIDTIVSDVNMPRKTGFDLLTELKANDRTKDIPVIILTGNAENDLKRRGLDLGAADLLNKPVNMEDLTARVRSALRIKEYEDLLRQQNAILEEKVLERTAALEHSRQDIIWRLAKAGEFRDQDTGDHVLRVAACSRALAEAMGLDTHFCRALFITSPLHDIGKIGVPDGILFKPGKLTHDERQFMQRHCEMGAAILLEVPQDGKTTVAGEAFAIGAGTSPMNGGDELRLLAAEIAMTHHERWDGAGYPRGLFENEIPISGQIVAIADVYDALRSVRAYKPAFTVAETVETMRAARGTHFAPEVFAAFEGVIEVFETIRREFAEQEGAGETHETSPIR